MIFVYIVFALAIIYLLYDVHTPSTYYPKCDCGRYNKCKSSITYTTKGGISRNKMLDCGKVRDEMRKCNKILNGK